MEAMWEQQNREQEREEMEFRMQCDMEFFEDALTRSWRELREEHRAKSTLRSQLRHNKRDAKQERLQKQLRRFGPRNEKKVGRNAKMSQKRWSAFDNDERLDMPEDDEWN